MHPLIYFFVSMWDCIQGQAQKENQRNNLEACGLKLVLENGLQIEIGNSGTADLHATPCHSSLEQKRGASQKSVLFIQRGTFFLFFFFKPNPIWLSHIFFLTSDVVVVVDVRFQNVAVAVFILVHSWLSGSLLFQG